MANARQECNGQTTINFLVLTMIRGTTPLMMFFAVHSLNSASLVVALKCGITSVMFLLSGIWICSTDDEARLIIKRNLINKSTYWKLLVIGFLQSAAPYILAIYSLQFLPPTMIGVFMVTTPWWTMMLERLPCVKMRRCIPGMIKVGMFFGLLGTSLMLGPVIRESIHCKEFRLVLANNRSNITSKDDDSDKLYDVCLSGAKLATGIFAMLVAPIMWAGASVFWKLRRHDTHYLVSSLGQNIIGALIAAIVWAITNRLKVLGDRSWYVTEPIVGILFLGVATGWLATLLVKHLYSTIGGKTTNLVLTGIPFIAFIEDTIFVEDVIKVQPYVVAMEIIGLLLVSGGVFISNLPSADPPEDSHGSRRSSLSEALLNGNTASEGIRAGLNQSFHDEIHQYAPLARDEEQPDVDTEEEINSFRDSNTAYPKLSQVT